MWDQFLINLLKSLYANDCFNSLFLYIIRQRQSLIVRAISIASSSTAYRSGYIVWSCHLSGMTTSYDQGEIRERGRKQDNFVRGTARGDHNDSSNELISSNHNHSNGAAEAIKLVSELSQIAVDYPLSAIKAWGSEQDIMCNIQFGLSLVKRFIRKS